MKDSSNWINSSDRKKKSWMSSNWVGCVVCSGLPGVFHCGTSDFTHLFQQQNAFLLECVFPEEAIRTRTSKTIAADGETEVQGVNRSAVT